MLAVRTIRTAFLALAAGATLAFAGEKDTVAVFYDLLSNPGSESHAAAFQEAKTEGWESVGDYSGQNKTREAFLGQLSGQ